MTTLVGPTWLESVWSFNALLRSTYENPGVTPGFLSDVRFRSLPAFS
jgi:hypothetical protein